MPMIPFVVRFPELGARETRSVIIPPGKRLPEGSYGFFECYCNERGCDCRRVTICVLRPETGWGKIWANISFGWESLDFYRQKCEPFMDPVEAKGPRLDELNEQSECAEELLELFEWLIESPEYVARIKRHYEMFREAVEGAQGEFKKNALPPRRRRFRHR